MDTHTNNRHGVLWHWLLVFTLFHLLTFHVIKGETTTSTALAVIEEEENDNELTVAMEPLYTMTEQWLEIVQPSSKGSILEQIDFAEMVLGEESNGSGDGLFDFGEDWEIIFTHYIGYTLSFLFGMVFITLMPIVGFCYTCCRCCGFCGGGTRPRREKGDKICRIVCGAVLFALNTSMLAAVICAFFTNELLRQQTDADENHAVLPTVGRNLERVIDFRDEMIDDVRFHILDKFVLWGNLTKTRLVGLPSNLIEGFANQTGTADAMEAAIAVADSAERIGEYMSSADERAQNLRRLQNRLTTELTDVKNDIATTLNNCPLGSPPACGDLLNTINALNMDADYNSLDNITESRQNVDDVLDNDIIADISSGELGIESMADDVAAATDTQVQNACDELTAAIDSLHVDIDTFETSITNETDLEGVLENIEDAEEVVESIGNTRYYVGVVIPCLLLVIVLLIYVGLLFGVLGRAPDELDRKCLTSATGGTFIISSFSIFFLFASFMMVVCMTLFTIGGVFYTEGCRFLLDDAGLENSEAMQELDHLLEATNVSGTIMTLNMSDILRSCKENRALYGVVNLDSIYNLTEQMENSRTTLTGALSTLNDDEFSIPDVVLYTDDTEAELTRIRDMDLAAINFTEFRVVLEGDVATMDLDSLATEIDTYANNLPESPPRTELRGSASDLRNISSTTVNEISEEKSLLLDDINNLDGEINGPGTTFSDRVIILMEELDAAQINIDNNTDTIFSDLLQTFADEMMADFQVLLDNLIYALNNEMFKCRPLYLIMDSTINSICRNMLEPFNGYWFSLGWCLVFFIPCIIVGTWLASYYKTPEVEYPQQRPQGKDFEDGNYDLYSGSHDNIPLQERKPAAALYNQNTGFENDYTASRSANYRADNYPGAYPNAPSPSPPHYGNDSYQYYS